MISVILLLIIVFVANSYLNYITYSHKYDVGDVVSYKGEKVVITFFMRMGKYEVKYSNGEKETVREDDLIDIEFLDVDREYWLWKKETSFLSVGNFDNIHYQNMIKMGKRITPYILKKIKKPNQIVNILPTLYPGVVEVNGYVSLETYCRVWRKVLKKMKGN